MAEKRPYDGNNHQNDPKRQRQGNATSKSGGTANISDQIAAAKAGAAAAREKIQGIRSDHKTPSSGSQPSQDSRSNIEAMKARVAAAAAKSRASTKIRADLTPSNQEIPELEKFDAHGRGGLGIGLHPALLNDISHESRTHSKGDAQSRVSSTAGNDQSGLSMQKAVSSSKSKRALDLAGSPHNELKNNPYHDPTVAGTADSRGRKSRNLLFHQKGKFIAQAAALRRQANLEDMKRRIAESARKAGLDEDRSEQSFIVEEPPQIEWWDEGLLAQDGYTQPTEDVLEKPINIDTDNSIVTRYIQHPVMLAPPQEKNMPGPKPMFMTREEQAKKRRQDRTEVRKEQQAKVRLGLQPPEPPKVKKSNLMRVLGEQAVKDPTAVEARVNREIAERLEKHEQDNEERKLTKEQRHEKLAQNQAKDAAKGVKINVYKIDSLAYGKHRYQIDVNAKQHALTGIVLMNPKVNLVIVEGGQWSISKYRKLMLQRIKWTEIAPPTVEADDATNSKDKQVAEASFLKPTNDSGALKDQSENQCVLIWEGEERQRAFKKWGSRVCETDAEARKALERSKMENMWQLAKNWIG